MMNLHLIRKTEVYLKYINIWLELLDPITAHTEIHEKLKFNKLHLMSAMTRHIRYYNIIYNIYITRNINLQSPVITKLGLILSVASIEKLMLLRSLH